MIEVVLLPEQLCGGSIPFPETRIDDAIALAVMFEREHMPLTAHVRLTVEVSPDGVEWRTSVSGHTGDDVVFADGRVKPEPRGGVRVWAGGVRGTVYVRGEIFVSPPFVTKVVAEVWR